VGYGGDVAGVRGVCAWLDEGEDKLGAKAKEVDDIGTELGYQGRGERPVRGRAAAGSERCFEECEQQSCVLTIEQEGALVGEVLWIYKMPVGGKDQL
jgi:hypothetical protein